MSNSQLVFLSVFFVLTLGFVLRMIVKHQLREVYAVVWVVVTFLIPATIFAYPFLEKISNFFGIASALNFLIFVGFVISYGLLLHFSALNSGLQRNIKNSIQKIAVLESDLLDLSKEVEKLKKDGTPMNENEHR